MKLSKRVLGLAMAAAMSTGVLCGCGQDLAPEQNKDTEKQNQEKTGVLSYGYFYQEDGICLTGAGRFMYADWKEPEFEYICTDLTCDHVGSGCSARRIKQEGQDGGEFCLRYEDRLIIMNSYSEWEEIKNDDPAIMESQRHWYTDVYEADLNGTNREKKATIEGGLITENAPFAAVQAGDYVFFGGPSLEHRKIIMDSDTGLAEEEEESYDGAIYRIDLADYSCQKYGEHLNGEGTPSNYDVYVFDHYVYGMERFLKAEEDMEYTEQARWFRIDLMTDECRFIREFSYVPGFEGAIGDRLYYVNGEGDLYMLAMDAPEEEQLVMQAKGDIRAYGIVLDDEIMVATDGNMEGENRFSEYTWLDKDGQELRTVRYKEWVSPLDRIGDYFVYTVPFTEEPEWWCDMADIPELEEKSTYIGHFIGWKQDEL